MTSPPWLRRQTRSSFAEATARLAAEQFIRRPEVLDGNRFPAARDLLAAEFVDPRRRGCVPAWVLVVEMLTCMRMYGNRDPARGSTPALAR